MLGAHPVCDQRAPRQFAEVGFDPSKKLSNSFFGVRMQTRPLVCIPNHDLVGLLVHLGQLDLPRTIRPNRALDDLRSSVDGSETLLDWC